MPRPVDVRAAYYPALDGLRAVAVALVIAYHLDIPHMGGGLLGVGVFFTLSGYLITSILLNSWNRRGSLGLSTFWVRRARRLLPAVVVLLVGVLAATALVWPSRFGDRLHEAWWALIYVANWATIINGESYWAKTQGPSPFSHLWSLSVEEQFYLIWPLVLLGLLVFLRGNMRKIAAVTFALGALSMVWLALCAHPGIDPTRAYEGTDTRAGGLLWGAALAMMWHPAANRVKSLGPRPMSLDVLGVVGLLGIFTLVATTTTSSMFLYRGGIALLTIATCAALVAATHPETIFGKVLAISPLRWIGERTYGIYLWHMPVVAFLPLRTFYGHTVIRAIIVIAITLALACLSWSFIENPIRQYGLVGAWRRGVAARWGQRPLLIPPFAVWSIILIAASALALSGMTNLPQTSVAAIAHQAAQESANKPGAAPAKKPAVAKPIGTRTSCTSVTHIGDSTSEGFEDGPLTYLTNPAQRIRAQYQAVGVKQVTENIRGARSIVEHFKSDRNGAEAVQDAIHSGFHGCWVIALGMNDAATIALGGTPFSASQRIDKVMQEVNGQPVLWVNTVTQAWANLPGYANANMQKFNAALVEATKKYPNLRVYDWAGEALPHPEWFLSNDANHNNAVGAAAKAHAIARALVAAYPDGQAPSKDQIVSSH